MFLNATMLAGIAGAMLPLVLHLFGRARHRKVEWGAMLFLNPDPTVKHHGSRLKELVLLLIRMAMVATLAIALARPVVGSTSNSDEEESTCTIIMLDRSSSMSYEENGQMRLELARRAALNVIQSLRKGDEAALVQMPLPPQDPELTTDLQSLATTVSTIAPTGTSCDEADALAMAARLLNASRYPNRQIVLICDRQATSWRNASENFAKTWRDTIQSNGQKMPRFTVIPIGGVDASNAALASFEVVNPPIVRGVPADLKVQVKNYGNNPWLGLNLSINIAGVNRDFFRKPLNLGPNATAVVHVSQTFDTVGSQVLTARIGTAGLNTDDNMDTAINVVDPIPVLLLGDRNPGDLIRLAIAPFTTAHQTGDDLATVDTIWNNAWPPLVRAEHPVTILSDVENFSPQQVRQLEQYVYDGGGLLIVPGKHANIDDYNKQLWHNGAGVMPAELLANPAGNTKLSSLDLSHPVFSFMQAHDDSPPASVINQYFPTRNFSSQSRVIARYATNDPFMIEGSFGRGRVLLVTTSLGLDWTALPRSTFYLPMLQSAVRYLSNANLTDQNILHNTPIIAWFDDPRPNVTVSGPNVTLENNQPDITKVGSSWQVKYSNTSRWGRFTYHVTDSTGQENPLYIMVHAARDESDLTSLSEDQWKNLENSLGFHRINPESTAIDLAVNESRRRRELWPVLIGGVVLLAMMEMLLARVWTRGQA